MAKPKSEPVENAVVDRIEELLSLQKKSKQGLIRHLGLANGTFTSWSYRNGKSYLLHIDRIAEFLGTTPNYLLQGIDDNVNFDTLSAIEIEILYLFRIMKNNRKHTFIAVAHHFVE